MIDAILSNKIILVLIVVLCVCIIATIRMYFSLLREKLRYESKNAVTPKTYKSKDLKSNPNPSNGKKTDYHEGKHDDVHQNKDLDDADELKDEDKIPPMSSESKSSKREIRAQQRREKKEEARRKREAEIQEKKKRAFNPLRDKPEQLSYTNLSVVDGVLIESGLGKTSYYRYWSYEDRFFYEFFCEEARLPKVINNHSVIIDPFCQKSSDSKAYNEAKTILTIDFGELDRDLRIISKTLIQYK